MVGRKLNVVWKQLCKSLKQHTAHLTQDLSLSQNRKPCKTTYTDRRGEKSGTVQNFHISEKYLHELTDRDIDTTGSNLPLEIRFIDELSNTYTNISNFPN